MANKKIKKIKLGGETYEIDVENTLKIYSTDNKTLAELCSLTSEELCYLDYSDRFGNFNLLFSCVYNGGPYRFYVMDLATLKFSSGFTYEYNLDGNATLQDLVDLIKYPEELLTDTTYTVATGDSNGQIKVTPSSGDAYNVNVKGLAAAAYKGATTSVTSGSNDLVTSGAVYTAIQNLPEPMIFKGTLGTNGTITSLPTAATSNEGYTYKVITAGKYANKDAKAGDIFISTGSAWELIPAGDTDSDTWRNIKVNGTELLGTGISTGAVNFKSGTNVTVSGSGNDITISATDTNTHYTTGLYVGATNTKSNAATSNGGTYLKLYDDSTKRAEFKITGSGATTVTSDANGNITISSTDNNTDTNTSHTHDAGVGLVGSGSDGTSGGKYTYKAKLKSETALTVDSAAATTTSGRVYPVAVDKSGYLAVNVPWTDTDTNTDTNQKVKTGSVTFGANDVVEFVAGSNVSISGDATNKKITISATDTNTDTNTWRKVQLNGTDKLGTGTSTNPLNIKAGSNMTITESNGTFTFSATDTNTDTNTTYDLSAAKSKANGSVTLDLTAGGSGSGTDSVTIKGTGATTVTTDANGVITINSTDTNTWRDVIDNLTSTATDKSLSANQGKVLKTLVDSKIDGSYLYHTLTDGAYYYDSYQGSRNFRMLTENMLADTLRFQASTVNNKEYWDYNSSSWKALDIDLSNLFDGDFNTSVGIPHAKRKFRFTITANSGWPTTALIILAGSWFDSGTVNNVTGTTYKSIMTIETRSTTSDSWATKATANFSTQFDGTCGYVNSALHTGHTLYRITVELGSWTNTASSASLRNICILSNYAGSSLMPLSFDGTGKVTAKNTLAATTLYENGTSLTSKYAAKSHSHDVSIATSSGTNELNLAHGTKYALTAGGDSFVFTMPSDTNTWRGIQDNLTSTSTTDSLSANQGKVLKEYIDNKASSSHGHGNMDGSGCLRDASVVVVTDANKKISPSSITTTELSYLDGVTSNIQTQLDGKTTLTAVENFIEANSEEVDLGTYFTKSDVNTLVNQLFTFDGTTLIIKDQ